MRSDPRRPAKLKEDASEERHSEQKQHSFASSSQPIQFKGSVVSSKLGIDKIYLTRAKKSKENQPTPKALRKKPTGEEHISSENTNLGVRTDQYLCKITRDLLVRQLPDAFKKIDLQLGKRGEKSRQLVFARFLDLESLILNAYAENEE